MCGIAGFWPETSIASPGDMASTMIATLHHRGPDAQAVWHDPVSGVAIAHARLAIVDLSPSGAQPMHSASRRFVIVFNGEIYNHRELRQALEKERPAVPWRGHSDTETLLAAIECWGLGKALNQSVGMFAFALWDVGSRKLVLARDRFGEKPLYWSVTPRGLVFASEMKALVRSGLLARRLSRDAAAAMMWQNNIPAPMTVFDDVHKLMPGHWLEFASPTRPGEPQAYWRTTEAWARGKANPFVGSDEEAIGRFEVLLGDAVRQQMVADVPLGAFLSGGIDSSTVVALMQAQSSRPVRTFSIGFREAAYNEADAARAVAARLGTDHTELYVTPADALAVIPRLPTMYCEPFADSSQIPTHLVACMARQHVTVALSGDAGDETFGGYNRYLFGPGLRRRIAAVPRPFRQVLSSLLESLSPSAWNRLFARAGRWMPASARFADAGDKIAKIARALPARSDDELYASFTSQWPEPEKVVPGSQHRLQHLDWVALGLQDLDFTERMMVQDALGYLPDDILVKVDRAAMATSLETRVPFLDHRLYEFAASLPLRFKLRDGVTKWLVRQVLYRHVPKPLIDRPKVGFGVPIDQWLRSDLREWAESLLSPAALQRTGMFETALVQQAWRHHQSGRWNLQHQIWCVLMYQAWHAEQSLS
jgi:asparagine synthase (glutamine-hydrolysing)